MSEEPGTHSTHSSASWLANFPRIACGRGQEGIKDHKCHLAEINVMHPANCLQSANQLDATSSTQEAEYMRRLTSETVVA